MSATLCYLCTIVSIRAGRYLRILVKLWYYNQTINVAIVQISVKRYHRFRVLPCLQTLLRLED